MNHSDCLYFYKRKKYLVIRKPPRPSSNESSKFYMIFCSKRVVGKVFHSFPSFVYKKRPMSWFSQKKAFLIICNKKKEVTRPTQNSLNLQVAQGTNSLQSLENGLGARDLETLELSLLLGVDDLAVVDDDGVAGSALAVVPADGGGEGGVGIGGEDLGKPGLVHHCL